MLEKYLLLTTCACLDHASKTQLTEFFIFEMYPMQYVVHLAADIVELHLALIVQRQTNNFHPECRLGF